MQHRKKTKEQLRLGKIVSERSLTINNLINSMLRKHLTPEQRNELSALLRAKVKKKDIVRYLRKDRTSIWRELKRNSSASNGKYYARAAKRLTKQRRIKANSRFRKLEQSLWLRNHVIKKLKRYWSPEQIAGRLKRKYPRDKSRWIGKDSIYKFVYLKRKNLVKYLRYQKGKYRRRYGARIREKQREKLKKRRIDARPDIVATKQRIGDWEGDTMIGQDKKPAILTHTERKSGLILANKIDRATGEIAKERTIKRFRKVPKSKRHTLTYDNGSEFSEYKLTERKAKVDIYFAYPYHSWEGGCNENANGLLRQFFPKKSLFGPVTQKQIEKAVRLLNSRPPKRLNYLTPYEVFNQKTECCTLE